MYDHCLEKEWMIRDNFLCTPLILPNDIKMVGLEGVLTRREMLRWTAAVGANLVFPSQAEGVLDLRDLKPEVIDLSDKFLRELIDLRTRLYGLTTIQANNTAQGIVSWSARDEKELGLRCRLYGLATIQANNTAQAIVSESARDEKELGLRCRLYGLATIQANNTAQAMVSAPAKNEDDLEILTNNYAQAGAIASDNTAQAFVAAGAAFYYKIFTELHKRYPDAKSINDVPAKEYQALRDQYNIMRIFGIQRSRAA